MFSALSMAETTELSAYDFRIWAQFIRRAGYLRLPMVDYPDLRERPCRT